MTNAERVHSYATPKNPDIVKVFACMAKASGKTVCLVYSSVQFLDLFDSGSNAFTEKADGFHWVGRMVNKIDRHTEAGRLIFPIPWDKFPIGKNGFRSDAQEQAVLAALNEHSVRWEPVNDAQLIELLMELDWEWTGHDHRLGVADLKATLPDGRTMILEVKGINSKVYHATKADWI